MSNNLDKVIESIVETHKDKIDENGRHYLEVCLGVEAKKLGFADLEGKYSNAWAVIPLKEPVSGMKVRIDGRTFINYAQFDSGVAVPGYVAGDTTLDHHSYTAQDSMVLNFS